MQHFSGELGCARRAALEHVLRGLGAKYAKVGENRENRMFRLIKTFKGVGFVPLSMMILCIKKVWRDGSNRHHQTPE